MRCPVIEKAAQTINKAMESELKNSTTGKKMEKAQTAFTCACLCVLLASWKAAYSIFSLPKI